MSHRLSFILGLSLIAVLLIVLPGLGQQEGAAEPAGDGATAAEEQATPSAEDVLEEMQRAREEGSAGQPAGSRADTEPGRTIAPDSALAGVAPGEPSRKLHREGSFVVRRRGRMVPAQGGAAPWMFTFESDKDGMQDPPMYLMPCGLLERMELIREESDEPVSFIISGQVFVYHDANYLLPTVMRLAPRRGNLGG